MKADTKLQHEDHALNKISSQKDYSSFLCSAKGLDTLCSFSLTFCSSYAVHCRWIKSSRATPSTKKGQPCSASHFSTVSFRSSSIYTHQIITINLNTLNHHNQSIHIKSQSIYTNQIITINTAILHVNIKTSQSTWPYCCVVGHSNGHLTKSLSISIFTF